MQDKYSHKKLHCFLSSLHGGSVHILDTTPYCLNTQSPWLDGLKHSRVVYLGVVVSSWSTMAKEKGCVYTLNIIMFQTLNTVKPSANCYSAGLQQPVSVVLLFMNWNVLWLCGFPMISIILRCRKLAFMQLREPAVLQRQPTFKQDYTWQLVKWLSWWVNTHWSCLTWPSPWQGSHLVVILLEEVELFLQAVQVSSQSGDDLVVVGLCPPQSLAVPLYRLAQGGLRLPPAEETQWRIKIKGKGGHQSTCATLVPVCVSHVLSLHLS